ncbi:hypothetical protein ES692_01630 [Psychroserpens burtonensis]|uniref:DUF3379 domain-containing protein n=1 Tax=Psychroserpens burtonensis TaxID=49278 RepID=A0A5C7BFL3_9FLAO|nr:hypothetical protein [Psychroserpens burtonensis]TXE19985.1 hypothetical protein ES692_01630 [Psychroserpens burtonensis]
MVFNSIEKLLEKYDNGETTIKEEQKLKAYFTQDDVVPHLESYRVMFQYFSTTKQEDLYTKDVPLKTKKSNIYQWISVAALLVLSLGIFTTQFGDNKKTYSELTMQEQKDYDQAVEVFSLVGSKFDQGESNMAAFGLMSNKLSQGVGKFEHVSEFSEATNKMFKSKKKKQNK